MSEGYVTPPASDVNDNDRLMAALAYVFGIIVPLIILLSQDMKNRAFQRYHAINSLGLSVAMVAYEIIVCILYTLLTAVSAGILGLCLWILFVLPLVPMILYAVQAYQGRWVVIPVITDFMKQQKWL